MSGRDWVALDDRRVGLLGGTFDPVHYGHLVIAEQVREALGLDRVLFVPARIPPHKPDAELAPAEDRAAMVDLAIAGNPAFAICRIELEREGPSYTADTVGQLVDEATRRGVSREFYFILSSEALAGLQTWHDPLRLLALCRLAVVPRPGAPLPDQAWLKSHLPARAATGAGAATRTGDGAGTGMEAAVDRVVCVQTVALAHSASDVRRRAAAGHSIRYLVPPAVEAYIREHRLYRSDNPRRTA
jgi:nicotinate-nucleotide adenylyltransferase